MKPNSHTSMLVIPLHDNLPSLRNLVPLVDDANTDSSGRSRLETEDEIINLVEILETTSPVKSCEFLSIVRSVNFSNIV